MYELNGIVYAGDPAPILQVSGVRPLDDYRLWIRFSTGEAKIYDCKPLLDRPAFLPLKDVEAFRSVYIDYGVPVWQDGEIDLAPEELYENGVAVDGQETA